MKRECYIAYSIASESKKKIPPKTVFIKAPRSTGLVYVFVLAVDMITYI